jgi:hypothetical protein
MCIKFVHRLLLAGLLILTKIYSPAEINAYLVGFGQLYCVDVFVISAVFLSYCLDSIYLGF